MKLVLSASALDVLGSTLTGFGLFYTGSGIYQILYSSVVIFTALLSRFVLKKPLSGMQWMAVLLVNVGLTFSASSSNSEGESDSSGVLFGSVIILIGTVLVASAYVVSELLIGSKQMSSENLCVYTGLFSTMICCSYTGLYTIPQWSDLMAAKVSDAEGDWYWISIVFAGLCLNAYGHNVAYFSVLETIGSVSTGLLQSLRAVLVFYLSSFFYCDLHPEQCLTFGKSFSALVVICGVVLFTLMRPAPKPKKPKHHVVDV